MSQQIQNDDETEKKERKKQQNKLIQDSIAKSTVEEMVQNQDQSKQPIPKMPYVKKQTCVADGYIISKKKKNQDRDQSQLLNPVDEKETTNSRGISPN